MACSEGVSEEEYCEENPKTAGCPKEECPEGTEPLGDGCVVIESECFAGCPRGRVCENDKCVRGFSRPDRDFDFNFPDFDFGGFNRG